MLVFCDGFDHYATAQAVSGQKWDTVQNITIGATYARSGGQGAQVSNINSSFLGKNVTTLSTYVAGTAALFTAFGGAAPTHLIAFMDGGTVQLAVDISSSGVISIVRNGTTIATGSTAVANQYRYWEFKATIHGTTGSYELRLDGATILTATGVNTSGSGTVNITAVRYGMIQSSSTPAIYLDDIYLCDTTGSFNNTFLGDVKVTAVNPTAAGAFTQWTRGGTDSGNDYSQVNETTPPDEDTKYITDSTVNDRDSFKFTSITLIGQIYAAVLWTRARKDDAGTRTLANVARSSAVDTVGASYNLTTTYQYYGTVFETDPATSALWMVAGLNAAEFGVKTIA